MLGKLIKHDLNDSKRSFFAITAVTMVLSLVAGLSLTFNNEMLDRISFVVTGITLMAMFIIGFMLVFNGYKKSLFGQNGYLVLTLPVSKNKLLLSKIIGALIWFNFMSFVIMILSAIAAYLEGNEMDIYFDGVGNWLEATWSLLYAIFFLNVLAFVAINVLFMTITFANSTFKKRLHWVIAGALGLAYYSLYVRGAAFVVVSFFDMTASEASIFEMTLLVVYSLIVGLISYLITLYLLNKRIELE